MSTLSAPAPDRLPDKGVTHLLFNIWKEKLEDFLARDSRMTVFMTNGAYASWDAYVDNPYRIIEPMGDDNKEDLLVRQKELSNFINKVANVCNIIHYKSIILKSTSLQWIYNKLREHYNIQEKEPHLFDLFDLQYQPEISVLDFYEQFRKLVIVNLKKKGDIIKWQNNKIMEADEELSPTFEDIILVFALILIDSRLLGLIKSNYEDLIGRNENLMDQKRDILDKIPTFLVKIEDNCLNNSSSDGDPLAR